MTFKLTSCQARNTFPLMRLLTQYLKDKLSLAFDYVYDAPWQDRARWLHTGKIQLGWICSKPYAQQLDTSPRLFAGIAVPVMTGTLYAGEPVYYSYLVVHKDHAARSLRQLRNGRVSYNEPGSQSGYFSLLTGLAEIGETARFFAEWQESGSHANSLARLKTKRVDAAAIDSTLWDYQLSLNPEQYNDLKIIGLLGPFPGPPLAAHVSLPGMVRARLKQLLFTMHVDPIGQEILQTNQISHFVPVDDGFYRTLLSLGR